MDFDLVTKMVLSELSEDIRSNSLKCHEAVLYYINLATARFFSCTLRAVNAHPPTRALPFSYRIENAEAEGNSTIASLTTVIGPRLVLSIIINKRLEVYT